MSINPSADDLSRLLVRREIFEAAMSNYLAGVHEGVANDDDKRAARQLLDLTIKGPAESAGIGLAGDAPVRRRASRFGDGLSPILKDIMGPDVSERFVAQIADRFWASLRASARAAA